MKPSDMTGSVLVIGGGIGGIQAALDLADSGFRVYLIEKDGAVGGAMAGLDKTFPTNDCSMCILSPKLVECGRHMNIEVIVNAELKALEGEPGAFTAVIGQEPRFISMEKCTGCGECAAKCPVQLPDPFNSGFSGKKAVSRLYEQAYPPSYAIDGSVCRKCGLCVRVCAARAIDFDQKPRTLRIPVGAVIASPGYQVFDPTPMANFGYGRFPNVLTGRDFERILSASGPYRGRMLRPSDGRAPERIAWIQCVGSRDTHRVNHGYCSSVCCTYAVKQAVVAREHGGPGFEAAVFCIDVRTHGKDFERFYLQAESRYGVEFVKSEIHRVWGCDSGNLLLRYPEDGRIREREFDLVVLSTGMVQDTGTRELASRLGVSLNSHGFCQTESLSPVCTSVPGVLAAGAFSGPKDIPETVMGASAAAAKASSLLAPARHTLAGRKTPPTERDVKGETPRIGVFVCHCGENIGSTVDVGKVSEYARTLPHVAFAEDLLFACSQDSQRKLRDRITRHRLNRVVVAACTPRTHEDLFAETLGESGLNPHLFEMANIRDQCSWVHRDQPEKATGKAKDLVRMSVAKAKLLEPLLHRGHDVNGTALVLGGGVAGMVCALSIAAQGYPVHLVEKGSTLGGNAVNLRTTIEGDSVPEFIGKLSDQISENPLVTLHTDARVLGVTGYVGNFTTLIGKASADPGTRIDHGVAVIATGAREHEPDQYLYRTHPGVFSFMELEKGIDGGNPRISSARNVVFIQCVGSRNDQRPYCSRTCCGKALKLSLNLAEKCPEARVYVLYRDMRAYGFLEEFYLEARKKGVQFLRYHRDMPPRVEPSGNPGGALLRVEVTDQVLNREFCIEADIIGLATAMVPSPDNGETSGFFKVPLNRDGFFMEAHAKLRPVDFPAEGVFVCGLAHSPKTISETIVQAGAAASRASVVLSRERIEAGGPVCVVDQDRCRGCGLCVDLCPSGAVVYDEDRRVAEINEALCKGCGVCASSCRCGAVSALGYTDNEVHAMIHGGVFREDGYR